VNFLSDPLWSFIRLSRKVQKWITAGKGANREIEDYQLSRQACYLTALNCQTEEGAFAKGYFAAQTRRAETLLPPADTPPPPRRPWFERLDRSILDHRREVIRRCPAGWWTVYTATTTELLIMEDEFIQHCLPIDTRDLPDGSIGKRWSRQRDGKPWAGPIRNDVPLLMPQIPIGDHCLTVFPRVYSPAERQHFEEWLNHTYLPECLPDYLTRKFGVRRFGLTLASAADYASRVIAGQPARLPPQTRERLAAAGCRIVHGTRLVGQAEQRGLFDH
jgi:hypothetical protein